MNKNEIKALLNADPFRPFTIHMSNGRALEIQHPDQVMLTPSKVLVGTGYQGEHMVEGVEHLSYLHLTSLQEQ